MAGATTAPATHAARVSNRSSPLRALFHAQARDSDLVELMQLLMANHLEKGQGKHRSDATGLAPLPELLEAAGEAWQRRTAHIRACLEEGGACDRCASVVRVLCVTPDCTHLLCVDCASRDRCRCAHCGTPYKMQARRWVLCWLAAGHGRAGQVMGCGLPPAAGLSRQFSFRTRIPQPCLCCHAGGG